MQVAIAEAPELVKSGQAELSSTLTPLNCAAAQNHVDCVQLLIDAGAPLEAMDGFGLTPLMVSRKQPHVMAALCSLLSCILVS
jgi:ankyrin repeat protein